MIAPDQLMALVATAGLPVVGLVAVLEGPIITVLAGWAAAQGLLPLWPLAVVLVLADLIGDLAFYALGRQGAAWVPQPLRDRLGLHPERLDGVARRFHTRGGRILIMGKLTHSAGALILTAAGAARMPLRPFVVYNLMATVPKSLIFLALGHIAGHAWERIGTWIANGSWILLALIAATFVLRRWRRGSVV